MARNPLPFVQAGIQLYAHEAGLPAVVEGHYLAVDEARARLIAQAYEALPNVDSSPETKQAYKALAVEVVKQYFFATNELHMVLEPWESGGQPYASSAEMQADVSKHHLYFFTGGEPHPALGVAVYDGLTFNDLFRAVHDLFGHAAEGYQFGPRGEENAWLHHSQMFSPLAQRALTTETRGQNSWVNFGPYSHLPVTERPYARQKAALLPAWCCDWQAVLFS
jgi:hypothetical protein